MICARPATSTVMAVFLLLSGTASAATNISIDGSPGDWGSVPISYADGDSNPTQDLYSVRLTHNVANDTLYVRIDYDKFVANAGITTVVFQFADGTQAEIELTRVNPSRYTATFAGTTIPVASGTPTDLPGMNRFFEMSIPYALLPAIWATNPVLSYQASVDPTGGGDIYLPSTCGPADTSPCWMTYNGTGDTTNDAQVISFTAATGPSGVVVRWETGAEVECAGFFLFRETRAGLVPVIPELVPGAGTAGSGAVYELLDASGRTGDSYLLQDVDERGRVTDHPPVIARPAGRRRAPPAAAAPELRAARPAAAPLPADGPGALAAILGANAEGAFVIEAAELIAAGIDPATANASAITLTRRDAPVGTVPGAIAGAHLFFAAPPDNGYDGVARYRLSVAPHSPAQPPRQVQPGRGLGPSSFRSTVISHGEEVYNWYVDGDDPYAWRMVRPSARGSVLVDAPAPLPAGGGASLKVVLWGGRDFPQDPDHRYELHWNGAFAGLVEWDGKSRTEVELPLAASQLEASGRNRLEVIAAPGVHPADYVYLHDVTVTYDRAFAAHGDRLTFEARRGSAIRVGGFSSSDVILLDVTDPGAPELLTAHTVPEAGAFTLSFRDPGIGARRYHATTTAALRRPSIRPASPAVVAGRGADLLVVTSRELQPALEELVAFRRAQGLLVEVVTTEEVYDAYTGGDAGPRAIQALVDDALATWSPAPRYLLLAGQGSMDPRARLGFAADREQVPTPFVRPVDFLMRTPSDISYAMDGNSVRLAVGRIPARTVAELRTVVAKILAQEAGAAAGRTLGVADGWDGGPTTRFEEGLAQLVSAVPAGSLVTLHARTTPDPGATLAATLAGGVDVVAYQGHAWTSGWGWDRPFLRVASAAALRNARRPFVISSACWEGNFSDPRSTSVAWALLGNPAGGSIGSFAPTTVLPGRSHEGLAKEVVTAAAGGAPTLGDAVRLGQQAALDRLSARRDAVLTFGLIGDPSARNPAAP